MFNQIRKLREERNESGFTLIELLIVIVILGILAAVVVFAVGGVSDKGKSSACKADLKTVETAVEAFYAQTGGYPPSGTGGQTVLTTAPNKFLRSWPSATVALNGYAIDLGTAGAVTVTGGTAGACP